MSALPSNSSVDTLGQNLIQIVGTHMVWLHWFASVAESITYGE